MKYCMQSLNSNKICSSQSCKQQTWSQKKTKKTIRDLDQSKIVYATFSTQKCLRNIISDDIRNTQPLAKMCRTNRQTFGANQSASAFCQSFPESHV